jgi:FkbM family methyltransferase
MKYFKSFINILEHPSNKQNKFSAVSRIVWWKINQKLFKLSAVVEIEERIKCICYPDSSFGGLVVYTKLPEYFEMKMIQKVLKSNDVFVDVGASIGVFSLLASSIVKKGKVFAFEPSPKAANILKQNINLNEFENIEVLDKVVSDKSGFEYYQLENQSEIDHISTEKIGMRIESVTLDSFLKQNNIKQVKLVKIDVEGAEMKVLNGLKYYLSEKKVDLLMVEVNKKSKNYGYSSKDLFSYLRRLKYELYRFSTNGILTIISTRDEEDTTTFNIIATSKKNNLRRHATLK